MFWFEAQEAFAGDIPDTDVFAVVLADGHDDGEQLEIQGPGANNKDNDYCLVVNLGPVAYECVSSWYIIGNLLHLRLSPADAQLLGIPSLVEISIEKPMDIIASVAAALQRILRMPPTVASATIVHD